MEITSIGLVLGYKCNIRCRHCLWGDTLDDKTQMAGADACDYIDQAVKLGGIREVGFTGGESFLFRTAMKEAMGHADKNYALPSFICTNSSWAKTREQALSILEGYYELGLHRLQLSIDDYHQEWVPLERVKYAVEAAIEFGIKCKMVCIVDESTKSKDDYIELLQVVRNELVEFLEFPVTPTGYAAERIKTSDLPSVQGIPSDTCTMLSVVNILPDGSVTLCCGAPFSMSSLTAGNLKERPLKEIIEEAQWNPVFNALAVGTGSRILAEVLHEKGEDGFLRRGCYASSCDACQHIMGNKKAVSILYHELSSRKEELYIKRKNMEQM